MAEELAELVVTIAADITELKEALVKTQEETKKVANALSMTGIVARKVMLTIANSSILASVYMAELNDMVGILADEIMLALAPVIDPIMDFLWEMVDAFVALDENHKLVVAAIVAISVALWLLAAHPVTFAVIALIAAFIQLRKVGLSNVEAFLMVIGPLGQIILLVIKLTQWLTGRSLVPALESMANVIKTMVMPQLVIMKAAFEGIQLLVKGLTSAVGFMVGGYIAAGTQIKQTFTQVFNFLGGGLTSFKERAEDAFGGLKKKMKSVGGLF